MILAAFILLGVGLADLIRQFTARRQRWILLGALAAAILILGALFAAGVQAAIAVVLAAGWLWLLPLGKTPRAGAWPAVGLAVVVIGSVLSGARSSGGVFGVSAGLSSPIGEISIDLALLIAGIGVFLLESSNIVVRVSLLGEIREDPPNDGTPGDHGGAGEPASIADESQAETESHSETTAAPLSGPPRLKGGRLIGPLERLLVAALTLAGAYALVAALIAAKGIVRFPEISKDGSSGRGAEYFLVGSLVSWVQAIAAAFLIWYSFPG